MKKQTVKVPASEKQALLAALGVIGIEEYSTCKLEAGGFQISFKADSDQMFSLGVSFADNLAGRVTTKP